MSKRHLPQLFIVLALLVSTSGCNIIGSSIDANSLVQYGIWNSCPDCVAKSLEINGKGNIIYKYSSLKSGATCQTHIVLQEDDIIDVFQQLLIKGIGDIENSRSQNNTSGTSVYIKYREYHRKGNTMSKETSAELSRLMSKYKCIPRQQS